MWKNFLVLRAIFCFKNNYLSNDSQYCCLYILSYCQEDSLPLSLETSSARNKGKLDFGNIMLEIPETFFQQLIILITELHSSSQRNSTECDHYFFLKFFCSIEIWYNFLFETFFVYFSSFKLHTSPYTPIHTNIHTNTYTHPYTQTLLKHNRRILNTAFSKGTGNTLYFLRALHIPWKRTFATQPLVFYVAM